MNAPVLSRRLLLGASTAVLGGALPAAVPALASLADPVSPEAAALLAEFRDVAARFNAAGRRLDAAQAATVRVPEPEALFVRGDDFWLLGCVVPAKHWRDDEPRLSYGFADQIAEFRALPAGDGDRRRADRRDEIVGAWDRWHAERRAAREVSGEAAAGEHYRAVSDEHDAFLLRLIHLCTSDPGVMRIKAAAVLNLWSGDADQFDAAVKRVAAATDGDPEDALCFSLIRDVLHGLGAEHRVSA